MLLKQKLIPITLILHFMHEKLSFGEFRNTLLEEKHTKTAL